MSRPRIYLSGPLTCGGTLAESQVAVNRLRFEEVHQLLGRRGWDVVNPCRRERAHMLWSLAMREALAEMLTCENICQLPGWSDSLGARWEYDVARVVEMGIWRWYPAQSKLFLVEEELQGRQPSSALRLSAPRDRGDHTQSGVAPDAPAAPEGSRVSRQRLRLPFAGIGALPTRGYTDDAGLDLVVWLDSGESEDYYEIPPNEFADIPCGLCMELPPNVWAMITGRSSTIRRRGLLVAQGIIDSGYRGPLFAGVWNLTSEPVRVHHGERLAQLILFPNITRDFEPIRVDEIGASDRGSNGFGSTGT